MFRNGRDQRPIRKAADILYARAAMSSSPAEPFRLEGDSTMRRQMLEVAVLGFVVAVGLAACEKGPMQEAGEKIDRATDQDELIGKGPLEKAGAKVDDAVKDLKK
jgi:hypothetical protein